MHVASAGALDLIAPATPSGTSAPATSSDAASGAAAAFAALLNAVLAPTVPVATPEPKAGDAATETPTDTAPESGDGAADGMHTGASDVLRFKLMIHTARSEAEQPARATTLPVAPTSTDDAMGPGHTAGAHGRGRGLAALVAGQKPGLARGRTRDADGAEDADATSTTEAGATLPAEPSATPPSATPDGATTASAIAPTLVTAPTGAPSEAPSHVTTATPATTATSATSALTGVDADLRARLTRVIDRMRDEHGHDVTVVEGYRSQERQDRLYEQGRTRPGAVVTWTQTSQHTSGRAVDVAIDGGWEDGPAFAQLQQIAREEGLRTLGARDPGHLELPRPDVSLPNGTTVHADAPDTPRRGAGQAAGRVAEIAAVARVADVAVVATPARVGASDGATSSANAAKLSVGAVAARAGGRGGKPRHETGADTQSGGDRRGAMAYTAAAPAAAPVATSTDSATPVAAPARAAGVDAADRVARALEIRETGAPRTMSTITLQLDNAAGGQDRIRVGLRGIEVGTSIDLGDARAADQLRTNIGELRDALGRHGLTADTVQISGAARTMDVSDASRALSAAAGATRAEASSAGNGSASSQQQSQRDPSQQQTRDAHRDGQRDERRSRHGAPDADDRQDPRSRGRRTR